MNTLNIAQQDQINEMIAEGKTSGQIARELKIKKAIIEAFLAEQTPVVLEGELITGQEGVVVEDAPASTDVVVEEAIEGVVVEQEPVNDVASKLAAMLAQANAAPANLPADTKLTRGGNVKFETSSSKNEDGTNKQRRNTNVTTRKIAVFFSKTLNMAFISTNLAFTTKKYDAAIKHIKQASQKALQPMFAQEDFKMELRDQLVNIGAELDDAKGELYDLLGQEGWDVVGSRPKTSFAAGSRLPAKAAPADETVATESVVAEEEVAA